MLRLRLSGRTYGTCSCLMLVLAACSTTPKHQSPPTSSPTPSTSNASSLPALPPAGSGRGGYYLDDGPGDNPPAGLLKTPDPIPKIEPFSTTGNKPYAVFGTTYTPVMEPKPFKQRGIGSWYGKKFHGQKTSSGEIYDMYKLTAAHPTLPIPSYARVTNLRNGAQVIVRINDRGPFHSNRIIDLSYTAALKLDYLGKGSSELEVERILPEEIERMASGKAPVTVPVAAVVTAKPVVAPSPVVQAAPIETMAVPQPAATVMVPLPPVETRSNTQEQPSSSPSVAEALLGDAPPLAITSTLTPVDASAQPASANGFYLQFGAFSAAANAEAVRSRMMQNWDASLPPLAVDRVGAIYRVDSGPFATRDEATLAAEKARAASEVKPLIVRR